MTDSPPSSPLEHAASSWEEDESPTTLLLRALSTLLAGGFLVWAQHRSQIDPGTEWNRWIWLSIVANFLLPLGMVWMFFGQGLRHLDWLPHQQYNAWNYGWNWRAWRRHLKIALLLLALMLPLLWISARNLETRTYYQSYFPAQSGPWALPWLLLSLAIYMFCWEWFHRGFLLFGIAQGCGPVLAVLLQAAVFGFAHYGKPGLEFPGSFAGGVVLGAVAWREKSFAPAFYAHALIHIAWAVLVLF
ncbi:MAG TPA: CPBP family intramembrane glutamic endopeptidase [Abditibacteriaceae bacterium]|nr:CPBP family intramembrane glutamic endopeptidase [Abditibacteriaceae bacterium]